MKYIGVGLIAWLVCLCMVACSSKPKSEAEQIADKLGPEGMPEFEMMGAAAERKTASDPFVNAMLLLYIHNLRSAEDVRERIGAARGLGAAAYCGIIGASSKNAREALYKASISDPDKGVQKAAAEALQKVESYRKGEMLGRPGSSYGLEILQLTGNDPEARKSAAESIGRAAEIGMLGPAVAKAVPALRKLAKEDRDEAVRAAAAVALQKADDYRATLDPAVLVSQP
jgi:hypothetical protein